MAENNTPENPPPARVCGVDYPKDVVIVHQSLRGPHAPSLGNMVVKLETYLRIAGIPYQADCSPHAIARGPKGKMPWIEYNGTVMGDSEFIIEFLNKEVNVDIQANLSNEQKAQARSLQRWMDEALYWCPVYSRWVTLIDDWFPHVLPQYGPDFKDLVNESVTKMGHFQGIGRHTKEEIEKITEDDLNALSVLLGNKPFFFGESPISADCAVFGHLVQMKWNTPSTYGPKQLIEKLPNLSQFLDRIKSRYWPDWDDCCDPTKTTTGTILLPKS